MATKTAIVFAGGGSLGAVQVGMLRALVEANLQFDMVVGASVGAINGAYFAARPDADGVEALAGFWRGLGKADIFPLSWLDTCRGLIKGRGFLLQPAALNRLLDQALPIHRIEEAKLPLYIVTDLLSGAETVLSTSSRRYWPVLPSRGCSLACKSLISSWLRQVCQLTSSQAQNQSVKMETKTEGDT